MGKVKAALIHFSISVVIFCSIVAVAIVSWYPPPYFFADGGWQGRGGWRRGLRGGGEGVRDALCVRALLRAPVRTMD